MNPYELISKNTKTLTISGVTVMFVELPIVLEAMKLLEDSLIPEEKPFYAAEALAADEVANSALVIDYELVSDVADEHNYSLTRAEILLGAERANLLQHAIEVDRTIIATILEEILAGRESDEMQDSFYK